MFVFSNLLRQNTSDYSHVVLKYFLLWQQQKIAMAFSSKKISSNNNKLQIDSQN